MGLLSGPSMSTLRERTKFPVVKPAPGLGSKEPQLQRNRNLKSYTMVLVNTYARNIFTFFHGVILRVSSSKPDIILVFSDSSDLITVFRYGSLNICKKSNLLIFFYCHLMLANLVLISMFEVCTSALFSNLDFVCLHPPRIFRYLATNWG